MVKSRTLKMISFINGEVIIYDTIVCVVSGIVRVSQLSIHDGSFTL